MHQAITWTNAETLLFGPLGTNFSEIFIEIHTFSFMKMHLKILFGKWQSFCLGLIVLDPPLGSTPVPRAAGWCQFNTQGSTGPLSDQRYRQVRLDLRFIVRMRAHQAPLPPTTADCHRLLPAIIVAWETSRGIATKISDYGCSGLDQANTWTNSVLIGDHWICHEMCYSLYVRTLGFFTIRVPCKGHSFLFDV